MSVASKGMTDTCRSIEGRAKGGNGTCGGIDRQVGQGAAGTAWVIRRDLRNGQLAAGRLLDY